MKESPLVSIIVPVYGVEAYLPECISSLQNQTYDNIEIILVDDESPDQCGEICDSYSKSDGRVKVIHKKNGGAASARNMGLDVAKGEFICFVDSDDIVLPEYIQELYRNISLHDADIAVCGFEKFSKSKKGEYLKLEDAGLYNRDKYLLEFLKNWTCSLLWNKIFRRKVIGCLRMEEGHRIDDEFFTYQVVLNSNKIVVFQEVLYQYRIRKSGVMRNINAYETKLMMDRIEYMAQRYVNIQTKAPKLKEAFFLDLLDSYTRYWGGSGKYPEIKRKIRCWSKDNMVTILQSKIPFKKKFIYIYKLLFVAAGDKPLFDREDESFADLYE